MQQISIWKYAMQQISIWKYAMQKMNIWKLWIFLHFPVDNPSNILL